jgi:hypothetical protein
MVLAHLADEVVLFGRAVFFGGIDHAFEDIFFDTFAEGEGTEVFGHGWLQRLNADFTNRFAESNA